MGEGDSTAWSCLRCGQRLGRVSESAHHTLLKIDDRAARVLTVTDTKVEVLCRQCQRVRPWCYAAVLNGSSVDKDTGT